MIGTAAEAVVAKIKTVTRKKKQEKWNKYGISLLIDANNQCKKAAVVVLSLFYVVTQR